MSSTEVTRRERVKVAAASMVGTALEWYDFYLYGAAAALVFNKIIFVNSDPTVATILAFATFAIGYLVRPLGGLIFGRIGDVVGRRSVLVITLLTMGTATLLMAFVPTYEQAGIWAPVILVVLRLVQGIGAGAEFGGAAILSVEYAAPKRRGFLGSWPMVGVFVGLLMSSGAFALVSRLPEDQFLSWGWRIPFAASLLVIAVALYIRLRISESPAFEEAKAKATADETEAVAPISTVFKSEKRGMLVVFGTQIASNTVAYLNLTFLTAYLTGTLGMGSSLGPTVITIAALVTIGTIPLLGALSDRIGRKPVVLGGIVFSALFIYPYFWLIDGTQSEFWITVAVTLSLSLGVAATVGPQAAYFSELFTARARFTGLAFSRELAGATSGGLTPLIAVALVAAAGGESWLLSLYVIGACLVGGLIVGLGPETLNRKITAISVEELHGEDERPLPARVL
jgi:MHS family shikimate/dehydroshikimate transporter-like MFS transporter